MRGSGTRACQPAIARLSAIDSVQKQTASKAHSTVDHPDAQRIFVVMTLMVDEGESTIC